MLDVQAQLNSTCPRASQLQQLIVYVNRQCVLYKFYTLLTFCRITTLNYTEIFTQLALLLQLKFTVYHSVIVHSCNVRPCNFLRQCPLLQLPPSISTPAMSDPVFSCSINVHTCNFSQPQARATCRSYLRPCGTVRTNPNLWHVIVAYTPPNINIRQHISHAVIL